MDIFKVQGIDNLIHFLLLNISLFLSVLDRSAAEDESLGLRSGGRAIQWHNGERSEKWKRR